MIIGLATWTSTHVNYKSPEHLDYVLGIVGSINYHMTEYFSHAKSYTNENDLRSDIGLFVRLAVNAYYEVKKKYLNLFNISIIFSKIKCIQQQF